MESVAQNEMQTKIGRDDFLCYMCSEPVVLLLVCRHPVPVLMPA